MYSALKFNLFTSPRPVALLKRESSLPNYLRIIIGLKHKIYQFTIILTYSFSGFIADPVFRITPNVVLVLQDLLSLSLFLIDNAYPLLDVGWMCFMAYQHLLVMPNPVYTNILNMYYLLTNVLLVTVFKLICLITVKWIQVLLFNTGYSIKQIISSL